MDISNTKTTIDGVALAAYQERLPGCRTFLASFFQTCENYEPEINYLNYVRDLRLYSATNGHIRENLSVLVQGFYDITCTTPEGLAARLDRYGEPVSAVVSGPRITYRSDDKEPPADYHGTVAAFKKGLLERTLWAYGGNRTHAARALGLQRTYLLRLMRDLRINVPPRKERLKDGEQHGGDDTSASNIH